MIVAYGYTPSGNCWKVRQILDMTGRPYRWVEVNSSAGETRTPTFLAKNPNGKVPIVELDDGQVITESNAILCHFAEGTRYLPPPGLIRTRVLEWLFFEQYSHEPYIAVARNVIGFLKAKEKYADRLPEIMERGYRSLAIMEGHLNKGPYLAGEGFTVADIALFAYTDIADEGEFDLSRFPAVGRWLERVHREPGLKPIRPRGASAL
jgi:glutathione S-transferase